MTHETAAAGIDGLRVRFYQEGDEPQLLDLLTRAFGRWPSVEIDVAPIEHLRWKLSAAPQQDCYHSVAEIDGRIVAAQLCVLHRFRAAYGPVVALRTWDAAVHPGHQGRGLIGELRRFFRDQVRDRAAFETGAFTRNPIMQHVLERDGQVVLGAAMETAIAPLTLASAVSTAKLTPGRAPAELARSAALLARWVRSRRSPREAGTTVRTVERFDERAARLVDEASRAFDYLIDRTPSFLDWRYADQRGGRFTIRLAEERDQLVGYAVLRETGRRAYVADLLALPGRLDVVEDLGRDALAAFRRRGATSVQCLIPSEHPYRPVLASCGFVGRRRRKEAFSVIPLSASPEELAFLQRPGLRLHLMLGDSDTI